MLYQISIDLKVGELNQNQMSRIKKYTTHNALEEVYFKSQLYLIKMVFQMGLGNIQFCRLNLTTEQMRSCAGVFAY